ncbi:MAG: hypothetical protein B7C54_03905 [Acidimicrobiales bacterium mtb01]|nr:response regulator [Actinomycetota bacterium]TEX46376.1 MAG: hypothetical protein B7C54_03905 [Acidimicrobiales bacterium mtb01]
MNQTVRSVLVVDDDESIRAIVNLSIRTYGKCAVTLAASGREALELLQRRHFDLIVLDVMIPEMDGPATLREIRRQHPNFRTPVAFLTAKAQTSDSASLLELGASEVISKPFDPRALVDTLCRIVKADHAES